ncbi:thymidine kinase [Thermococcus sp.]|uniref:thymidine kinase n=1 Tax=Thermococcus sp. TaxID=35749 RepID=UPI00345BF8FA
MIHPGGILEVITGPMFAGKTSELIKRIERQAYAKKKVALFKPSIDDRYSREEVVAHNGLRYRAYVVPTSNEGVEEIARLVRRGRFDVVGVDEVQFFPAKIVKTLNNLADSGIYVIASGLNLDFKAEPFPVMRELLVRADNVVYLTAVCTVCGRPATRSQRLIDGKPAPRDSPVILVGGRESYEARCRLHHEVP